MKTCNVCLGTGYTWTLGEYEFTKDTCEFCAGTGKVVIGGNHFNISHERGNSP